MPEVRKIIHIDMDAFFASVEQRDHPELRGKPVAVGGSLKGRGVIAAASYEARKYGVRSAMSSAQAIRLCPHLIFARHRFDVYKEVSRQIREIFNSVTDLVEPLSLDEAFLDVTENKWLETSATRVAQRVRKEIFKKTQLTASAGVAPNKFVAKVASDINKPNGICVVPPSRVDEFVAKLPVRKLWGVGPVMAGKLEAWGMRTAGDLREKKLFELEKKFGRFGDYLHRLVRGHDRRKVRTHWVSKSRGSERTFAEDITDLARLESSLESQADRVCETLQKTSRAGRTVTLKLRYSDFRTITRSRSLETPTCDASEVAEIASQLLVESTEAGRLPVRLIGVHVSGLTPPPSQQSIQLELPLPTGI